MDNNENTAAVTEMLLSTESVPKAIIASLAKALLDAAMGTDEGNWEEVSLALRTPSASSGHASKMHRYELVEWTKKRRYLPRMCC